MHTYESSPAELNPRGEEVRMEAADRMLQDLLEANHGSHTDVGSAQELIVEAVDMLEGLEEIVSVGPEVGQMVERLREAVDHLSTAIKQVH